ncbi:LytTR family transcriptional regulator DNA-binding domain-containing protein [Labilibaculum sp. DW002]|uniref:LytTR family transcriptional regulator DNA-binding domain-containing protein n=1 Tax=Paralabilibaculum antarcticum TaxID=2912572 RepID=A0ABT5VN61_9BACT|nr:LytTR family transcriptional regulator DNA-binding domain-containing protein [Labilibaculum sp. DW002]MDE5416876.1 LytTR family transcriptional regulator DNA-binding domain-containing protein [Labilibaculum sp. DW002]
MKAIIIDDEALARDLVRSFLDCYNDIEILGEYSDGFQGLKAINELQPDLVFLDVQMPKLTGFEMLELLDKPCNIVFTTAYNEYAIKAFEHNAVDYLLKPFSKERFQDAINKVKERVSSSVTGEEEIEKIKSHNDSSDELLTRVVVKSRNKIDVLAVDQIKYFEAQDDYVMIYTKEGRFLKQKTMKYFETHLNSDEFCRIHRSYLVKIDQISQLQPYEKDHWLVILKSGESLKVSRNGFKLLKHQLEI